MHEYNNAFDEQYRVFLLRYAGFSSLVCECHKFLISLFCYDVFFRCLVINSDEVDHTKCGAGLGWIFKLDST